MANETAAKRYYWLKLHDDFFDTLRIKKLRRAQGGDTFALIYLKLLLKAIKTDGVLTFNGIEEELADELALDLGEEAENVRATLAFLESSGLMKRRRYGSAYFPEAVENTGSETASTQRSRECRARAKAKEKALHCNNGATQTQQPCSAEKEKETDTRDRDREENKRERIREKVLTGEGRPSPSSALCAEAIGVDPAGKYGEYRNVKLTNDELNKVKAEFPSDWQARIDNLSAYIASTGKNYKSHLATIRNWARMERERGPTPRGKGYEGDNVFLAIAREEGII